MPKQSEFLIRSHQMMIEKIISDRNKEFVKKCKAKAKKQQEQQFTVSETDSIKKNKKPVPQN